MKYNIYKLNKPSKNEWKNLNILPFISFFYNKTSIYLNIGWIFICLQIVLKDGEH